VAKLADVLEGYAASLDAASKPSDTVRWVNGKLLGFFGAGRLLPLTRADMTRWAASAKRDYIRRGIVTLRTAHRLAGLEPPPNVQYEYEPGHRLVVPQESVRALIAAMPWGSPERAVAEIMVLTAARLSHVLSLRVQDVSGQFLVIRSRKGHGLNRLSIEEHPISGRLREVLDSVVPKDARPERNVILVDGRRPGRGSFRRRLAAASKRAGVSPEVRSFAWLRNFTITQLIESGAPIDVVSRMAGHASVLTTRKHYDKAKLLQARLEASGAMASFLGQVSPYP
jgi:integrase